MGTVCNNKCLGCDISAGEKTSFTIPAEKIKEELLKIKKAGFENVDLVGGEITIQKNFLELLKFASPMFSEINLATNGRIFAYEGFIKEIIKIIKNSLIELNLEIAIHGPNALIHESFTRTPGSFKQMTDGIKNIVKYKKYFHNLGINTLLLKSNYKYLDKILNLVLSFKAFKDWHLISFMPVEGRAFKNIKILMPRYEDLIILNNALSRAYNSFNLIDLDGFPHCLFNNDIIRNKKDKIHIINSDIIEVEKKKKIIRYFNCTFSFNKIDYLSNVSAFPKLNELKSIHNSFRAKLPICRNCVYSSECPGIMKEYINLFGSDSVKKEIEYLNKINIQ